MKLNFEAKTEAQRILLEYLEQNMTDAMKEKTNNGVPTEKDGQMLISKKTLEACLKYCCDEAKKMAKQGAAAACVRDDVVFGWAMHYFEEDSIAGTLYNLDGTEYKPVAKKTTKKTNTAVATKPKTVAKVEPTQTQASLFDMFDEQKPVQQQPTIDEILETNIEDNHDDDEDEEMSDEMEDALEHIAAEQQVETKSTTAPIYEQYLEIQKQYPTAVVLMRLGDFYETFGGNAIQVAGELNMTLTSRDFGLTERIATIGIPYHAADTYFLKIHALHDMVVYEKKDDVTFLPIKTKKLEPEKHWIDENTYVDENGEMHTVGKAIPEWITALFQNKIIAR